MHKLSFHHILIILLRPLRMHHSRMADSTRMARKTNNIYRAANKYYSSAGHHEQKNQKITGQIKFLAVAVKQRIKLVLRHSLCKNEFNVLVQVFLLHSFIYSISCLVK